MASNVEYPPHPLADEESQAYSASSRYQANPEYPFRQEPKPPKVDKKGYAIDPTPAEQIELNKGFVDWRAILTGKAWSVQKYIC